MKAQNNGTLTGRLTRDPEAGQNGLVRFSLAVDGYNPKTKQREADFIDCVAFGKTGETIAQWAHKGTYMTVAYHLKPRQWTDQSGQQRHQLSVVVDDIALGPKTTAQSQPQVTDAEDAEDFAGLAF